MLVVCGGCKVSLDLERGISIQMHTRLLIVQDWSGGEKKGEQAIGQECPHIFLSWPINMRSGSSSLFRFCSFVFCLVK